MHHNSQLAWGVQAVRVSLISTLRILYSKQCQVVALIPTEAVDRVV